MNKAERREQRARDSQIITKEVYLYFLRYFQKYGYSPSYQEIADALNIHIQTVRRHIAELMEDGLLATDHPGTPRTIKTGLGKLRMWAQEQISYQPYRRNI